MQYTQCRIRGPTTALVIGRSAPKQPRLRHDPSNYPVSLLPNWAQTVVLHRAGSLLRMSAIPVKATVMSCHFSSLFVRHILSACPDPYALPVQSGLQSLFLSTEGQSADKRDRTPLNLRSNISNLHARYLVSATILESCHLDDSYTCVPQNCVLLICRADVWSGSHKRLTPSHQTLVARSGFHREQDVAIPPRIYDQQLQL